MKVIFSHVRARFLVPLLIGSLLLVQARQAAAWGAGHEDVEREILKHLPKEFQPSTDAEMRDTLSLSHYPDAFLPFEVNRIGEASLARLEAAGMHLRYDLHTDKGRAVAFLELVDALREKRYDRANFWIACLGHSAADMAACNHDPLQFMTVLVWGESGYGLQLSGAGGAPAAKGWERWLDLSTAARDEEGRLCFDKNVDAMLIKDDGRDLNTALLDIMLYGRTGTEFCRPRGVPILEAAMQMACGNAQARPVLFDKITQLGAWAAVRVLRDVAVAQRLAATDQPMQLGDNLQAEYQAALDKDTQERDISTDALYQWPASHQALPGVPAIGVVVEPVWQFNAAFLGYGQRITAVEVANSFYKQGRPYRLVDVRDLLLKGLPSAKLMPVLVLACKSPANFDWMKSADLAKRVQAYLQEGGRIVWVGGGPPGSALPVVAQAMVPSSDNHWPVSLLELTAGSLAWEQGASWKFTRSPETRAITWVRPGCPFLFDHLQDHPELKPVLSFVQGDGTRKVVGVAWPASDSKAVFLPTYALFPYLMTGPAAPFPDPASETALDQAGSGILNRSLEALGM